MAPDNLKVGDIFIDEGYKYKVTALRTDGCGRYDSEFIGYANEPEKAPEKEETVETPTKEEKPVEEPKTEVKEEVKEEVKAVKKAAPKRKPAPKKKTTTKR